MTVVIPGNFDQYEHYFPRAEYLTFGDGDWGDAWGDNLGVPSLDVEPAFGSPFIFLARVGVDDLSSITINAVCRMQP